MKRIVVSVLVLSLLAGVGVAQAQQGAGWWNVASNSAFAQDVTIADDLTVTDQISGADVTASDDVTAGDDAVVTDALTVGGFVVTTAPANLTVADGAIITPTASFIFLTAAGAVGSELGTAGVEGTLVTFINLANQTITITETGTLISSGNVALAQFDTLTVLSDGTDWYEVAQVDN